MVANVGKVPKTGYWRINPQTGEAEWIEGSYQPPKPETIKQPAAAEAIAGEPDITALGEVEPFPSAMPPFIPPQPPGSELSPEAWIELNDPNISSEQWLAKWETLIQEERQQKRIKELEPSLRLAFPEMFDPTRSYGLTEEQLPTMVVEQLSLRIQEDYEGFLSDLTTRVGRYEAENILRQFGVQEEFILQGLDIQEQEKRTLEIIQSVIPEAKSIESFASMIETDWDSFFETIRLGGMTSQKRQLLELIGLDPIQINEIAMRPRLVVDVDGIRKLTDVDLLTKTAFDLDGNYIGMYNPATKEFTKAPPKNVVQKAWDWVAFSSRQYWELGESALIGILPEIIYPEMPKGFLGGLGEFMNETNAKQRENWRFAYRENKREYEEWLSKNPQIKPSIQYQEGAFQNPDLLKDPMYYVYEFTNILPLVLATAAIGVGTGGVGVPFFLLSTGLMGTVEAGGVYQDLLDAGAPEDKAAQMAAVAGGIIGSLESAGRIPFLRQISPLVFGKFKREAVRELARQGLAKTIKKFGRNFTITMFSETLTEDIQEIVGNVAVRVYDENRSIFENVPDITVKTLVGMLGFGLFGAGVSVRMVKPFELRGLSDAAKKAKGWVTDNKGNWYEKVKEVIKEERGAIELPGKPEEITPAPEVTLYRGEPIGVRPTTEGLVPFTPDLAVAQGWAGKEGRVVQITMTREEFDKLQFQKLPDQIATYRVPQDVYGKAVAIPKAEIGEPEAGLQPSMLPEEIAAKEVRPKGKGQIIQISMEDQLKLEQARRAAEEAAPEVREAYEAQEEIEGLKAWLQSEPAARLTNLIKKTGWYKGEVKNLTKEQYRDITGKEANPSILGFETQVVTAKAHTTKAGKFVPERTYKTKKEVVRWEYALDEVATEMGYEDGEALKGAIEQAGEGFARVRELESKIKTQFTEKPLETQPEPTAEEVSTNLTIPGQPKLTLKQVDALLGFFAEYINEPNTIKAWELTRELRRETLSGRAENLKARAQELIVSKGVTAEEGMRQAIREALAGELPVATTEYLSDLTDQMRDALFVKVYHELKDEPFEMASTVTALTNALTGKAIPREPGVKGGSAYTRLQRVFGDQPKVLKAIDKIASEKKPLRDVVEGIYRETGMEPIGVDQETADYLRGLSDIPFGRIRIGEETFAPTGLSESMTAEEIARGTLELRIELAKKPIPVAPYEVPIEDAFRQGQLWPRPVRDNIIRSLKELGMLPVDIGNFLRANKASVDFSFWRQQAPLIVSHPIAFAQANVEAWRALWSQKSAEASWERITRDPLYQIYGEAAAQGGDFLRPLILPKGTAQYKGTEEYGYSKGVERRLPKLTAALPWVKLSARAFETGTNVHNWLIFKSYYAGMLRLAEMYASGQKKFKAGEALDIQKEMVDFSKSLANFTARGSLGKFAATAPELSAFFFAPRMAIGRILSVKDLVNANPRVRLEAWKNAASFVGTFGGMVLLGAAMGWWEVEKDPKNAEYMSIRIGNTRIDPWGGFRQFLVFFARAISLTGVSSVTGAEYEVDPINLIQTFIRGKASPLASLVLDFWRGKNFIGEEIDVANKAQWAERVAPFAVWDIYEAYKDDPIHGLQVIIPAIVGAGVQTYTGDWKENFAKLGLLKYSENLPYGLTEPRYDTADFWSDHSADFKGVDPATLTKEKGFPDYIRAIVSAKQIQEYLSSLPSERLVSINADPAEGLTFADYRNQWIQRVKLVADGDKAEWTRRELQPDGKYKDITYKGKDALKAFDSDERTRNANLGNFSQRQFALLNEYWLITDKKKQAAFLEEHKAEIGVKPRDEYLRTHPKENAQLAVWGQAKLLTKEAYNQFKGMVKELDIPDNALPELTLPPEGSIDNYFKYQGMDNKNSWEAQLMLAKDLDLLKFLERQPIDTPIASLELKVKNRANFDKLDAFSTEDSPDYIADEKARAEAIKKFKVDNPEFVDDMRRIEAIEKGTDKVPVDEALVNAHVEYGKLIDQEGIGSSSAEAMLYRVDNPEYDKWRQDADIWGNNALKPVDQSKIPIWRIDVKYKKEDAEYDAIKNPLPAEQARLRAEYMASHPEYRMDNRRREAYGLTNSKTGFKFPATEVENYVAYNELSIKGKRRDRFLVDNPEFAEAMHQTLGIDLPDPAKVPSVEYDNIYDEWREEFDKAEGLADNTSKFYIEDPIARQAERDRMRYTSGKQTYSSVSIRNKILTGFGLAEIKREAYGKFIPDEHIDTYVQWRKGQSEGKPADWENATKQGYWFEDDWFLMENKDFYDDVYIKQFGNERKDFRKVPSRLVFEKYLVYVRQPHQSAKKEYRAANPDLEEWGQIMFDWTPIKEQERRAGLTPREKFLEEFEKRQRGIEERIEALE